MIFRWFFLCLSFFFAERPDHIRLHVAVIEPLQGLVMISNEVINFLIKQMNDRFLAREIRLAAAEALGYSGFSDGREALHLVADDDQMSDELRAAATLALGRTLHYNK